MSLVETQLFIGGEPQAAAGELPGDAEPAQPDCSPAAGASLLGSSLLDFAAATVTL